MKAFCSNCILPRHTAKVLETHNLCFTLEIKAYCWINYWWTHSLIEM